MELVSKYLTVSHGAVFKIVRKEWNQFGVAGTPRMADLIEGLGINRYAFRKRKPFSNNEELILAGIISAIDGQTFHVIPNLFDIYDQSVKGVSL